MADEQFSSDDEVIDDAVMDKADDVDDDVESGKDGTLWLTINEQEQGM